MKSKLKEGAKLAPVVADCRGGDVITSSVPSAQVSTLPKTWRKAVIHKGKHIAVKTATAVPLTALTTERSAHPDLSYSSFPSEEPMWVKFR